jgi:hypothetical protein
MRLAYVDRWREYLGFRLDRWRKYRHVDPPVSRQLLQGHAGGFGRADAGGAAHHLGDGEEGYGVAVGQAPAAHDGRFATKLAEKTP